MTKGAINLKRSRYISFLLAVVMLVTVCIFPLGAAAAVDLSNHNLTTVQKYFLRVIGSLARADYYETDVLASVTLAQAIYEGGWGRYSLPVGGCNLFGIKAYSSWSGMVYDQQTSMLYESYDDFLFSAGQSYLNTYSAWRAHESWAESVSVHSALFLNESKYAAVVGEKDYKVAAKEIVEAGYCNDYGYIDTVIKLIEQYGLTEYDDLTPDENGIVAIITKQERKLLDIGEEYTVPLTFYPEIEPAPETAVEAEGDTEGDTETEPGIAPEIVWASDNPAVATVDENGKVTAVAHGMTLVTATLANGREACCIVYVDCNATVIDKDVTVYNSPSQSASSNGKIYRGSAIKVEDTKLYTDNSGVKYYFVSGYNNSNDYVNGYVLANNVYLNKRNVSNIITVKDEFTLTVGQEYAVKTAVSPADAVDRVLDWTSSDDSVAVVDENGNITAKSLGTATITASASGGCKKVITIHVAENAVNYDAVVSAYEELTVRQEPSADSSRAGKIPYLSSVKVIGEPVGSWYKISGATADGKTVTGYANSVYIRLVDDIDSVKYGTANGEIAVYAEKSTSSLRYGLLTEGSELAILSSDEESGWSYIIGIKTTDEAIHGYARLDGSEQNPDDPNQSEGSDITVGSYYGRTTSDLHVRSGAGSSYSSVGQFANGTQIIISGETNGWYKVSGKDKNGNDVSGYSSADFITVLYSGTVNATNLNVRETPISGAVVATLPNGTKVVIVGDAVDGWYAIESTDGSIKGYCSADYIVNNGKLTVSGGNGDNEFEITDSDITIENGRLLGVSLGTTADKLLGCMKGEIELTDASGKALSGTALVGSGARLFVTVDGERKELAQVVVMGDVDGDGKVTTYDYLYVKRHFFGTLSLEGACYEASLVSGKEELGVIDYVLIKRHYFGTYKIS